MVGLMGAAGASAAGGSVTRQDDLLGWWKFDETSGTTADLTLYNGPTFVSGKHLNAIDVDGVDDYAESTAGPTNTGDCTVSLWVNCDVSASTRGLVGSYRYYTPGYDGNWSLRRNGTNIMLVMADGVAFNPPNSRNWTTSMSVGEWHLIGLVLDTAASEVSCWVDGVDYGALTTAGRNFEDMANGLVVGAFRQGGVVYNWFNGKIDDLRIYNAALSDSDMGDIWGSGNGDWP